MRKLKLLVCAMILLVITGCGKDKTETASDQSISFDESTEASIETKNDEVAPVIVPKAEMIGCIIGEENDLSDCVDILDDDENCKVTIDDSKVKYDEVGEYKISVNATDSAGNNSEITLPCYVVKNTSNQDVIDYISGILSDQYEEYTAVTISGNDVNNASRNSNYKAFQSDSSSDKRIYEIYSNTIPGVSSIEDGYYSGILWSIAGEVLVTNTNFGIKNMDSPWMSELTIQACEFTVDGSSLSEFDKVIFNSDNGEMVFGEEHLLGWGYSNYQDWSMSAITRTYCFESDEEIKSFSNIIEGDNVKISVCSGEDIVDVFNLSERVITHYRNSIEIYNALNSGDDSPINNVHRLGDDSEIMYVNTAESNNKTDIAEKVFPGDDVKVSFDNLTIVDNDFVTVKLKYIFEESISTGFTLSVTNKCDTKILFNLDDIYVGDTGVVDIMMDGNSGPAAGKTREFSYKFEQQDGSSLSSLKDFCDMNGTIEISIMVEDESYISNQVKIRFSFGDYSDVIEDTLNNAIAY